MMTLRPTDHLLDLNSPTRQPDYIYTSLWRAVILTILRDSCNNQKTAKLNSGYASTKDFRLICSLANLEYTMVQNKLFSIAASEETRQKVFEEMTYFKSKASQFKKLTTFK